MQLALLLVAAFVGTDAAILRAKVGIDMSNAYGSGPYGNPDCPCVGIDELEGETTVALKDGKKDVDVAYPADLGAHCAAWDSDVKDHPSCPGESWCKQEWCYVDPCNCKNVGDLPKPSSYLPDAKYQGKPVHYSYATCGGSDSFSIASKESQQTLKDLEKTCAVEVKEETWGAEACRCVGIGPQEGTTKVTIDGKLKDFPADTGSMCKKWEEDRHPSCKGDSPPSWCTQSWCYVDPCSCKLPTPPKTSSYLPESNYQGKPVYYSYQTCGGTDTYTSDVKDACVNQESSKDCAKLDKCAWNGQECLGKELVEVCEAETAKEHMSIGQGAHQNGKAVKQRTTDPNMDCEHGNWNDCHGPGGDYAHDGPFKPKPSGTAAMGLSSLVVLAFAMAQ